MALRFKINTQFLEIIDFAIIGDHKATIGRWHGLMRRIRQINNRQTPMTKRNGAFGKLALTIRSAMVQRIRHRLHRHR